MAPRQGVTHMVQTQHIQDMLEEARMMAKHMHNRSGPLVQWKGEQYTREQFLDRAANLARHAAEELSDESFRSAGFPAP